VRHGAVVRSAILPIAFPSARGSRPHYSVLSRWWLSARESTPQRSLPAPMATSISLSRPFVRSWRFRWSSRAGFTGCGPGAGATPDPPGPRTTPAGALCNSQETLPRGLEAPAPSHQRRAAGTSRPSIPGGRTPRDQAPPRAAGVLPPSTWPRRTGSADESGNPRAD
jgi:hypothetical protein